MKTNVKKLMMVFAATTMVACTNNDLFDSTAIEQNAKATYAENFAKKYPNVDLNQNWDYSTKTSYFSFGNDMSRALTRAAVDYNFVAGSWYEVDNNTLAWMHEKLTEGQDNRNLGKPFYMTVPGNEFTIIPIFQGEAGARWDLHVVVNGVDIKLWEKVSYETLGSQTPGNENPHGTIQIKDADSDEWHDMHGQWYSWGYGHWNSLYNTSGEDKKTFDWSQDNIVTAVRSIPYTFRNLPVGAEMYFYLEVTESGSDFVNTWGDGKSIHYINNVGAKQSSVNGMMLALQDVPRPANIDPSHEAMIIGCEDADLEDSDWDLNDLVLLVYGPKVPKPIEITEGTTVYDSKTVRYMIEDLGATDDFDFNDIVIDVTESVAKTPIYTNGVLTSWNTGATTQKAVIRHLGGTLPFQLTIGNTQLEERQGVLGADPNEVIEISGWNINTHNISINVQQKGNVGVYNHVKFPKAGEAPMIIAVDPSQTWMSERKSVPEDWFYIPEE